MTPPAWLWTKISDARHDYWRCNDCTAGDDLVLTMTGDAEQHVIMTGHSVRIVRAHTTTLERMAVSGDQHHL